ncbi:hypothetical protein NT98_5815 (plasmid) [Bacillus cereus]|nr:hypothetical protein NT98_5815 [Bacillus cereus]EAL15946.1 hypothetical protein protein [Bacillus cereus G9241]
MGSILLGVSGNLIQAEQISTPVKVEQKHTSLIKNKLTKITQSITELSSQLKNSKINQ